MLKHEIKVELSNNDELVNIIEKAYFKEGFGGKINEYKDQFINFKHQLIVDKDSFGISGK